MITQIGGLNTVSVTKDPRRKAQSAQLKNHSNISYKSNYEQDYVRSQRNAFWTSISVVAGAILFTMSYFILSSIKKVKP